MHDLTQINQQDDRGNQLYQYSSQSANPAVRRSQSTDAADVGKQANTHKRTHTQRSVMLGSCLPFIVDAPNVLLPYLNLNSQTFGPLLNVMIILKAVMTVVIIATALCFAVLYLYICLFLFL